MTTEFIFASLEKVLDRIQELWHVRIMQATTTPEIDANEWSQTLRSYRDYPENSLERLMFHMGCHIVHVVGKTEEHRRIVTTCAESWKAKVDAGGNSCTWHEAAEFFGRLDKCNCHACKTARKGEYLTPPQKPAR